MTDLAEKELVVVLNLRERRTPIQFSKKKVKGTNTCATYCGQMEISKWLFQKPFTANHDILLSGKMVFSAEWGSGVVSSC